MKLFMLSVSLLFLFLTLLLASPVGAASQSDTGKKTLPIISADGLNMGMVHIDRRSNLLYMDYDFDRPLDCRLNSIATHIQNQNLIYITETKSPTGRSLRHEDTYIAPRDAVIAFDLSGRPFSETHSLSSRLEFDCNDQHRTAWVSANGKTIGDNNFFSYQARNQSIRSTPIGQAPVDDGYRLVYNRGQGWWEFQGSHDRVSKSPTNSVSTTRQAPVDDGYRLVYNRDQSWWEWIHISQL